MLAQGLTLTFRKKSPRPILVVTRADGTSTWMKLYPGMALHDLAHYAIETILDLEDAFYGLLAKGYSIQDFEAPVEQRPEELVPANLPAVSLQLEHLVNLLLTELQTGESIPDFTDMLDRILNSHELPPMEVLTEDKLAQIRAEILVLRTAWEALPQEEALVFTME